VSTRKRKRPIRFLRLAFIYAGNDLRSHTLGACSTIGPAGLNLRRLEGVREPLFGDREPSAEILSVLCEGSFLGICSPIPEYEGRHQT
jgi:hypothetical protein